MMTATMAAAKDTNQLMLTNANANSNNNNRNYNNNNKTHNINTSITPTGSNGYPLGRQPFYQHATTKSKLIMPTITTKTTTTTTIDSTINIGLTRHTQTHTQIRRTNDGGEINERLQRNEMTGQRVVDSGNDVVVVDVEYADDDEGNVDGNGYTYRVSDADVTPIVKAATSTRIVGDRNLSVDTTRTQAGMPLASAVLKFDYADAYVNEDDVDDDDDDETDSFGSMETLSDNVAVWVDGEKHWVAGVDANTTCADLIGALLNYQNAQQVEDKQQQNQRQQQQADNPHHLSHHLSYQHHPPQQHMFNINKAGKNNENKSNSKKATSSYDNNNITTNTPINQSTLIKTSTYTKENCGVDSSLLPSSVQLTIDGSSTNATTSSVMAALTVPANSNRLLHAYDYVIVKQHRHYEEYLDGNAKVFDILPVGSDGPSRKECELLLRRLTAANNINTITHTNNNNNSNSTAYTALPTTMQRPSSPLLQLNTQVSSLLSTDKDSGMGSPVGSSRSARLRRRKYKSAATVSWLAQANTLHPRVSQRAVAAFTGLSNTLNNANVHNSSSSVGGKHIPSLIEHVLCEDGLEVADVLDGLGGVDGGGVGLAGGGSANERLLKIILAQDETIHRQLVLLREKERQISKIEEEKHRVRERELGKNYLLETYLNGLDEVAAMEPNNSEACTDVVLPDSSPNEFNAVRVADTAIVGHVDHFDGGGNEDVEIYIDEPYQRDAHTNEAATTTKTKKDIATTKITKGNNNTDARHSKKMKEDFSGGGGEICNRADNEDANELTTNVNRQQQQQGGNEKEIEAQLFWLEKIYALNKQLQREEETLLKLHAKIRKHQVKRAYQTKREVLQQIEKLDAELTLQCCDIRAVENKLHNSNEQLKQKLSVLERLSQEFIETMSDGGGREEERMVEGEVGREGGGTGRDLGSGGAAEQALTIGAYGQRTVKRMPDIIANDKHILATATTTTKELRAAEEGMTWQQQELQVEAMADELHTKQLSDVAWQQKAGGGEGEMVQVVMGQDAQNSYLPHATLCTGGRDLNGNLNERSAETNVILKRDTAHSDAALNTKATINTAAAATTKCATKAPNTVAACHASMAMTTTSCSASMENAPAIITTTTTTTIATTTTTARAKATTFACNNLQQTNSMHLLQPQHHQQQQQKQHHLHLPTADSEDYNNNNNTNTQQCVVANDVLIDAATLLATSATAAVDGTTQSNYPISCINHAAVHATSQHLTRQIVVAAVEPKAPIKLATTEQTLPPAVATLSVAYLTSSSSSSAASTSLAPTMHTVINHQHQQQQQQQTQTIPHHQRWAPINNDNTNDNNLLPTPSYAAHSSTKTLQKQMFGPKTPNQMLSTMPTSKIIQETSAALTMPSASSACSSSSSSATPLHHVAMHAGYCSSALRPTTPAALLTTPAIPTPMPLEVTTQCSNGLDITQLGTLV